MSTKERKRLTPKKVGAGDPTFVFEFILPDSDTTDKYTMSIQASTSHQTILDMTAVVPIQTEVLAMSSFSGPILTPNQNNLIDLALNLAFNSSTVEFEVNNGTSLPTSDDILIDQISYSEITPYVPETIILGTRQNVLFQCREGDMIETFLSDLNGTLGTQSQFLSCDGTKVWELQKMNDPSIQGDVYSIYNTVAGKYLGINSNNVPILSINGSSSVPAEMLWVITQSTSNSKLFTVQNVMDINNQVNDRFLTADTAEGHGALSMVGNAANWYLQILS